MTNPAAGIATVGLEAAYAGQLQSLLPAGPAWSTSRDSVLYGLLRGLALGFASTHDRSVALERELDPRATNELLPEWEDFLGLPDECTGTLEDLVARRGAVLARLLEAGGQSPAYFIGLAARFGWTISIIEYPAAAVGWSSCGDPITTEGDPALMGACSCGDSLGLELGWEFVWDVASDAFSVQWLEMGSSMGLPIATWGNDILECIISRAAPAHTQVRFVYYLTLQPEPANATLALPTPALV